MASTTTILVTHGSETTATVSDLMTKASSARSAANKLANFFQACEGGMRSCSFDVQVDGGASVAASGTVTLASHAATDTVTVGGVVFTCEASGATGNQYNVGGTDTLTAAALAAAINASTSMTQVCTATSALAVVTVTSAVKGKIGNSLGLAISAHGTVSGALLTGGVNTTANLHHLGV